MNEAEYKQWELDAANALSGKYCEEEIGTILYWFSNIRSSNERDLVGNATLTHICEVSDAVFIDKNWSLYNSLMWRLWIYAPYILKEE
jgi:hypothetical protein